MTAKRPDDPRGEEHSEEEERETPQVQPNDGATRNNSARPGPDARYEDAAGWIEDVVDKRVAHLFDSYLDRIVKAVTDQVGLRDEETVARRAAELAKGEIAQAVSEGRHRLAAVGGGNGSSSGGGSDFGGGNSGDHRYDPGNPDEFDDQSGLANQRERRAMTAGEHARPMRRLVETLADDPLKALDEALDIWSKYRKKEPNANDDFAQLKAIGQRNPEFFSLFVQDPMASEYPRSMSQAFNLGLKVGARNASNGGVATGRGADSFDPFAPVPEHDDEPWSDIEPETTRPRSGHGEDEETRRLGRPSEIDLGSVAAGAV